MSAAPGKRAALRWVLLGLAFACVLAFLALRTPSGPRGASAGTHVELAADPAPADATGAVPRPEEGAPEDRPSRAEASSGSRDGRAPEGRGIARPLDLGVRSPPGGQVGIPSLVPHAPPSPDGSEGAEKAAGRGLRNRGGPELEAVAAQLNAELMPLMDECIELARERRPELAGYLSLALDIVPAGPGRALVSAVRPQPGHDLDDPELFVCLRESALSVEGLQEPRSVSLTMPLPGDAAGAASSPGTPGDAP